MATRYWVGGSGNWDATSTTNWAATSGGASGASAPTSADDVIFDANSNTLLVPFTVTVTGTAGAPALCQNFSTGGAGGALDATMTLALGTTGFIGCYGSLTFPAANFSISGASTTGIRFFSTTTGKTVTTNGVSLSNVTINFLGVGGGWTLGSAFTSTTTFTLSAGTLDTGNYNVTCGNFVISGTSVKTLTLGSSTIASAAGFSMIGSNLTLNAGTSTINLSSATGAFAGGGLTFYNVSFTNTTIGTVTITGGNTFNSVTFAARAAAGFGACSIGANQTINGTLTLGSGTTGVARLMLASDIIGTQRTLTCAAIAASVTDIDFRDIKLAGAFGAPLTGTRLGNCGGNDAATITFTAGAPKYWNLAAGGNWNAAAWALSSGGGVATTNFPLAQDSIVIENTGLTAGNTITLNANYNIPTLGFSTRTLAMTFATGTTTPTLYGNLTLDADVTYTGTGALTFAGRITQNLTSAGKTLTQPITVNSPSGIVELVDNLTLGATLTTTLTAGQIHLNNQTLSTGLFSSSNSNIRTIDFKSGNITTTGSGTVWTTATPTNFSYLGTPTVNISNNSATATTVSTGAMTEAQSLNFNYTTGTYTLTDTAAVYKTVNFTGFGGTIPNSTRTIYGGLTFVAGMTLTAGANVTTFAATSGTNNITTAAKTFDFPITFNGIGGTWAFQDALTQGATRAFTITNGTVQLKASATSTTGVFATSGTNQKFLQSTTPGTQATLTQVSGTVNASYLTIQDINAIGGATWFAPVTQFNVDGGNNDGWDFFLQVGQYMYTRRKTKRLLIS